MSYERESFIKYYARRFYQSSLFMALLVGLLTVLLYLAVLQATALSVQPVNTTGGAPNAPTVYQLQGGNRQTIQVTGQTPEIAQPEDQQLQSSSEDTDTLQPTTRVQ